MQGWPQELALRRIASSGKRAAAIMSLIQSARLNGHDPYAYLKDVLTRLPTQQASEISELLPHRWTRAKSKSLTATRQAQRS
ncbi:putative transposase [Pseudomonas amygdali pv. morsprunorum]|uniref:Putative transposase n=1 Tax=Pseudomonas amygdali pv. morsprunorum TaxID=129138 RepID=A0A3M2X441_PSEA0|nr:transposase [Pseudomonas amygdali pv. morsprunorum str. M302280]RML58574.1 putative transposase [Pseudomonas amygdali pv. morsprunorum]